MEIVFSIKHGFNVLCRGAVRATRSVLAYTTDPEAKRPLLVESSKGLKKRPRSTSNAGSIMTAAGGGVGDRGPASDVVLRVTPGGHPSHSLPDDGESYFSITIQIIIPFLLAGCGMVGAGLLLDNVQKWMVYQQVPELIVLVPALLGLKGNLEMTLASRLSTEANLGSMDDSTEKWSMIIANIVLVQCQATVVGLFSAVMAVILLGCVKLRFSLVNLTLICACSTLTASLASLILGMMTSLVIDVSRKCNINPDFIATPLAAAAGDVVSLFLLSYLSDFFYTNSDSMPYLPIIVIVTYIAVMPLWYCISKKNKYTKAVLYNGWTPVISAMFISLLGGTILDKMVNIHSGVAVFQPVINGVGGNLVSIQASRLSTHLHQRAEMGILPPNTKILISPWQTFCSGTVGARTAQVLLLIMIPGHIFFSYLINFIQFKGQILSLAFIVTYLFAASIQVSTLLYIAHWLTHLFWSRGIDPDNSTIPYLTAIGDLLGITLLGLTFEFLTLIGQPMTDIVREDVGGK